MRQFLIMFGIRKYTFEDELVKWVEDARVALYNEKYAGKFLRR